MCYSSVSLLGDSKIWRSYAGKHLSMQLIGQYGLVEMKWCLTIKFGKLVKWLTWLKQG
ncbi:hypothetical protein RHMOL_Rhmol13G0141100 [Rhododendron molle]|uniref:Uncharacterized protein n=1 Tax=Rhododendron molle TaxID=49168 RepID=A0ACC0L704_RHOML|nr:hypothetical protein RHMOL_Rhmol13G0141100 [Rhododendron molle]